MTDIKGDGKDNARLSVVSGVSEVAGCTEFLLTPHQVNNVPDNVRVRVFKGK